MNGGLLIFGAAKIRAESQYPFIPATAWRRIPIKTEKAPAGAGALPFRKIVSI
jgi:hypothetical protein